MGNSDQPFAYLKQSIELSLTGSDIIFNHDIFAYLRIQSRFKELKQHTEQQHS